MPPPQEIGWLEWGDKLMGLAPYGQPVYLDK